MPALIICDAFFGLAKKSVSQRDQLEGHFKRVFGPSVNDPKAAIEALMFLFREVENFLNNGNTANLMDPAKRVTGESIAHAINVITTKQKAYETWRKRGDHFQKALQVSIFQRAAFELAFENSFDYFKDLSQVEHQKVLKYVTENITKYHHYTDEVACIEAVYSDFCGAVPSNLDNLELKAAIFAAFIENLG